MDKQRLLAAKKKFKEFQRSKQNQIQENLKQPTNPQNTTIERKSSVGSNAESQEGNLSDMQQNLKSMENNGGADFNSRSVNESPNLYGSENHVNNVTVPTVPYTENIQNIFPDSQQYQYRLDHESSNGTVEVASYNNFVPDYSRSESNSAAASQVTLENVDQNNHYIYLPARPFEQIHSQSYAPSPNDTSGSLQKEHLLQMANAVANALSDEHGLDESALKNCDLEQRNQFLTCCLEEQKKLVNQLHIQVSQSNSRISELEAIIATKNAEVESRIVREINPLKEQIQVDAQTIGILVGEKAELTATNSECQSIIKQKTEEVIDLSGKLKMTNQKVADLEKELASVKSNLEGFAKTYQELQKNCDEAVERSTKLKKENEDFELEASELRQKLNFKNTELANLQQELQEKIALLSLSELRMQQLTSSPQEINSLESQHHATKVLEHQLNQMKEALESVSGEKDEVNKKYQSYVQQLDERHSKLAAELEASKKIIFESEIREQSYIQRLSEMEQQLQIEKARHTDVTDKPVEDQSAKIDMLTKSMDNVVLELENLQSLLNERDNEIELLRKELGELHDIREQSLEATKLATALQGEQLGASRAVSQNQQLKTQLDEMHDAFIALSNTKLDLTEQLQAERTIGKKLNAQLNGVESQLDILKEELARKEAALADLEKEKLQSAQIEDQIQHYQAQSHSATTLQQELQKALVTIENLKKENQSLQSKLNAAADKNISILVDSQEASETMANQISSEVVQSDSPDSNEPSLIDENSQKDATDSIDTEKANSESAISLISQNGIPRVIEPVKELEKRFTQTMEKVADLTDEKQRLEHLVLQLQGETETIGEYVTLYQKQRSILQEKAKEREIVFQQVLEQRNQQQEQLHKLKVLVAQLLRAKNSTGVITATVAEESMLVSKQPGENEISDIEVIDGGVNNLEQPDITTSQILDLLTEIKDCNNSCTLDPNFHPCPWCSGKLIDV